MEVFRVAILLLGLVSLSLAGNYNYGQVVEKSLLFYEAQRTGLLPTNNRIPWRGDSFITDRGTSNEDLSGGYFDAGDFVKFGFPGASAMTMLAWGMYDSKQGYQKAGQWTNALACLRWGMDYMIKTHPSANVLYVQVGDGQEDHSFWGRPEQWAGSNPRPTLRATTTLPASEVAGEQAAAMAAGAMVFLDNGETAYGATLLRHAEQLYLYATTYRGKYSDSFPVVREFYNSYTGYGDEFLWAAAWLYRATREDKFRQDYTRWWTEFSLGGRPSEASWDWKQAHAQILLAKIDGSAQYVNAARSFCDWAVHTVPRTPKGLAFISEWGSLRHASNVAYICLQAASAGINASAYRTFAKSQIDYILGDAGRSFVVGYGVNPPQRPHHAASSCPNLPAACNWSAFSAPGPNPQILNGALVGGPDRYDNYVDDRADYVANEVTLDYNAGFQSALAELTYLYN
ncbi:endoglucanase E-4-like [Bradysia coprophila]|uniref:endoglucanase E-4-like n=1 Tax=Bradysia coprophila TaxID=38358 RepID=UPI00187DCFC5|nr:endoglucanase E-4-like [Bradysia coprophila]